MTLIPGLLYIPNFLDEAGCIDLIVNIDQRAWLNDLRRRVQHYGYKYDYTAKKIDHSMRLGALPDFLIALAPKLEAFFGQGVTPDQAIVNEYKPGQGIGKHVDCVPCFGPVVASISLGSSCEMEFERGYEKRRLTLESGSLLALTEEARYKWAHSIPARAIDNGVARNRRVSVTFRTVVL